MVDIANAIDFRLGHCNGEFHALRSSCPHGNYSILVVFRYMYKLQEKSPDR